MAATRTPLAPGHAFSIEPGIYVPGHLGLRLEDIVVAAADGPDALNRADHALAVVDGSTPTTADSGSRAAAPYPRTP